MFVEDDAPSFNLSLLLYDDSVVRYCYLVMDGKSYIASAHGQDILAHHVYVASNRSRAQQSEVQMPPEGH